MMGLEQLKEIQESFRLLMEYHSFLSTMKNLLNCSNHVFPSPYGVSFILIGKQVQLSDLTIMSFRLLMEYHSFLFPRRTMYVLNSKVSVSLWSIIHSYGELIGLLDDWGVKFPSPYGVSFILIVRAYKVNKEDATVMFPSPYGVSFILILWLSGVSSSNSTSCFRLLMEYHSFLLAMSSSVYPSV